MLVLENEIENSTENSMYSLIEKLFPICRSLTGNGVRETLCELQKIVPEMQMHEVPTGTQVMDWTIPKEWNINDAWIKDSQGNKIIDFNETNLHVMGYSQPVHKKVNLDELLKVVYTLPDQPDLIPYVTSYYKERYGFCMSENQKQSLKEGEYEIFIDSELKDGSLTYADIVITGKVKDEIMFSTYVCHPSMANNELSGPAVAIFLAKWLKERNDNYYTYRFVFAPETIGAITYLSKNLQYLKEHLKAGYVLTCCGDQGEFTYIASRHANNLADKTAKNILNLEYPNHKSYTFMQRGSDERQYCAPGVDLPFCSVTKTKYGDYPQYHTSGDNLDFVSQKGLEETLEFYKKVVIALENNKKYRVNCLCEPQLGKRGLYPTISGKNASVHIMAVKHYIAYCDGINDLIDISNATEIKIEDLIEVQNKLIDAGLLDLVE